MQLALSGELKLAKDTVRCMDKAFKDPKPIMGRLFAVSMIMYLLVACLMKLLLSAVTAESPGL